MSVSKDSIDWSSDNDFLQLSKNLPPYNPSLSSQEASISVSDSDAFLEWQLNRFNRTGTFNIFELFGPSFKLLKQHIKLLTFIYFSYLLIAFLCFIFQLHLLFIFSDSLINLIQTSICFSLVAGENYLSRLDFIFIFQGLSALFMQIVLSFLTLTTFLSLIHQKSTTIFIFFILAIIHCLFFYFSCFPFEGRTLSILHSISFSLRLSIKAIPIIQSFSIILILSIMNWVGFISFGITSWISFILKAHIFFMYVVQEIHHFLHQVLFKKFVCFVFYY